MAKTERVPRLPRPLYAATESVQLDDLSKGHAGLWYDKFCNGWQVHDWQTSDERRRRVAIPEEVDWAEFLQRHAQATSSKGRPKCAVDKPAWIRTVTQQVAGCPKLIAEFAQRQRNLIESLGGECVTLATESRFATGLGREHPIENGFAWHSTLGTPYLAGSGVKGLLRAFVRELKEDGSSIFGPDDSSCVGRIVCFDAVPTHPVQLEADVMTPHYGPYYESTAPQIDAPGDWHSPTPILFLVAAAGQPFQFAFAPRSAADKPLVAQVIEWLCAALHWLGAGAKTSVGYGRFAEPSAISSIETTSHQIMQAGPVSPARVPVASKGPRYKAGQQVMATRVEDPKGTGRLWFEADDGFGGTLTGATPEQRAALTNLAIGATTTLEVGATLPGGYNFRLPRPAKAAKSHTPRGSSTGEPPPRKGGRR